MYGWRGRIGLVIPTNNTVIEPEFARLAPEGVSSYASRLQSGGLSSEALEKMVANSHRAVEELRSGEMNIIAYACLATSLVKGDAWSTEFQRQIEGTTGRPAIMAAQATVDALRSLGVTRVALATPYPRQVNDLLPPLFARSGIEIASLESVTVSNSLEVCRLEPTAAYALARRANVNGAQTVCILATDFRTIDVLEDLERDLGKPVISTNQALMWRCLSTLGIGASIPGFGSLLRQPRPEIGSPPTGVAEPIYCHCDAGDV